MDEVTKAYLAGIIDGEGCIGIYTQRGGDGRKSHVLQVSVHMVEAEPVDMIAEVSGSLAYWRNRNANARPQRSVVIRGKKAAHLLTDLAPYIRIKRPQVELALTFQGGKQDLMGMRAGKPRGSVKITEEEWNWRESFRIKMFALNSGKLGVLHVHRAPAETKWEDTASP